MRALSGVPEKSVVEVGWVDSFSHADWETKGEHLRQADGFDEVVHSSVGYLLRVSPRSVSIVQSWAEWVNGEPATLGDQLTIPRCAVQWTAVIRRSDAA